MLILQQTWTFDSTESFNPHSGLLCRIMMQENHHQILLKELKVNHLIFTRFSLFQSWVNCRAD